MDGIIFLIVVLLWLGRQIMRFVKWAGQQAKGLNATGPSAKPVMPSAPLPMPTREPLRNIGRAAADDAPLVPTLATSAGFARQEAELARLQDTLSSRRDTLTPPRTTQAARPLGTLFGEPDDLLRAFIMQEVLGPPRRMRSARPSPQPSSDTASITPGT